MGECVLAPLVKQLTEAALDELESLWGENTRS